MHSVVSTRCGIQGSPHDSDGEDDEAIGDAAVRDNVGEAGWIGISDRPHTNNNQVMTFDNIDADDETDENYINYSNTLHHNNYQGDNVNCNDVDVVRLGEVLVCSTMGANI